MTSPRYDEMIEVLINQFQDSENFLKLIEMFAKQADDSDNILSSLSLKTWTDTADGVWLDYRGDWVGITERPEALEPASGLFTIKAIGAPDVPAQSISSLVAPAGGKLSGINGLPTGAPVDDDTFREYIKAKEFSTNLAPTLKNIVLFCEHVGVDVDASSPQTGLIMVSFIDSPTSEQKDIIKTIAPLLGGVKIATTPV